MLKEFQDSFGMLKHPEFLKMLYNDEAYLFYNDLLHKEFEKHKDNWDIERMHELSTAKEKYAQELFQIWKKENRI